MWSTRGSSSKKVYAFIVVGQAVDVKGHQSSSSRPHISLL